MAEKEKRGDRIEKEIASLKAEVKASREASEAAKKELAELRKRVEDLPVVGVDEAKQIYAAENAEMDAMVCPTCQAPLDGTETVCKKCGETIEWVDE